MTFTLESATGIWTNTGAGRSVVVYPSPVSGRFGVTLPFLTYLHEPAQMVLCSKDGKTAIEAAISGTNVVVRTVALGGSTSTVNTAASDTPASAPASVPHSLTAGVPSTLDVRLNDGRIEVRIDDSLKINYAVPADLYFTVRNAYGNLRYTGFSSSVSGCKISKPQVYTLVPAEPGQQVEVLIAVCDGHVLITEDGINFARIGTNSFNRAGQVSLTEFLTVVYGLDGTYRRKIDPVNLIVDNWAESLGIFPGSDGDAGISRNRFTTTFLGRVFVGGDPTDDRNASGSAVGDATDWDDGSLDDGAAWAFGTGLPGKIGSPLTGLLQLTRGVMIIGCVDQVWRMQGDPAFGEPDLWPALTNSGISGHTAITMATGDVALFHGPPGLFMVGPAGDAVPLSGDTLTTFIQVSRSIISNYRIIVIRDPERYLTHVFVTPEDRSQGTHVCYDERTGGFEPGRGGFLPIQFPALVGPTAACVFRGKLVLGTWDGRLLTFSNSAKSDDGEAIESRVCVAAARGSRSDFDVEMVALRVVLDAASDDASLRVYGGRNAQEAAVGTGRDLLVTATLSAFDGLVTQSARAPALSIEIWNTTVDRRWVVEDIEIDAVERAASSPNAPILDAYTPPALCGFSTSSAGTDDGDDGPGSGSFVVFYEEPGPAQVTASAIDASEPDDYTQLLSTTKYTVSELEGDTGDTTVGEDIDEF